MSDYRTLTEAVRAVAGIGHDVILVPDELETHARELYPSGDVRTVYELGPDQWYFVRSGLPVPAT